MKKSSLYWRIKNNARLNALWGDKGSRVTSPAPPDEDDVLDRRTEDAPPVPPTTIELAEMVAESDRRRYRAALRRAGVSEKQLEKMKNLDGLAKNTGMLLTVSLQQTHQNYIGQLHMLSEVSDELRERLKGMIGPDGKLEPLDTESASYLYRCYTEMVKEQGRGYQLMMEGAQAFIRMMMMAKGNDPDSKVQKKPGWGAAKQVNGHAKNKG